MSDAGDAKVSVDAASDVAADAARDAASDTGVDAQPDIGVDASQDAAGDVSEDAAAPLAGYQEPCTQASDCESGRCIEAPEGDDKVCTKPCSADDECGQYWGCEGLEGNAAVDLCFPLTGVACTSCSTNADCALPSDKCLDLPDGNSCGRGCDLRRCPDGYACSEVADVDGATSFQCVPTSGVCSDCYDPDGDGYGQGDACAGADCSEGDMSINPGASEACNGVDDNCDGTVDEGCDCTDGSTQPCYTGPTGTDGQGACTAGTQTCTNGAWGACENEVTPAADETCDGTVDDDCDGVVDNGCACDYDNNATGVCTGGAIDSTGACAAPSTYQADETLCDSLDNDCDGVADEGCQCDYDASDVGVCSSGAIDAATGDCAAPSTYQADETLCDGLDNDCDNQIDETCVCNNGETQSCGTDVGECTTGTQTCVNGAWGACQNSTSAATEVCDSLDNDCDGQSDEDNVCSCNYNSTSTGVCSGGTADASGACNPPPTYENTESSCDSLDNDCDGQTDEAAVDINSAVTLTSSCLTSGTGAQSAVVLELVDKAGDPITGANVSMSTSEGTLSAVSSSGNEYWAVLTPPSSSGVNSATITVSVDDACTGSTATMSTQPSVSFVAPFNEVDGGAGGCPADGNVRVQVVDKANGSPLANAHVMVGLSGNTSAFADTYGAAAGAANYTTTDANGYAEFHDFGAALDGPVSVTAAYEGTDQAGNPVEYTYTTYADIDAADFIMPVEQVQPQRDTADYVGDLTNIDTSGTDDIEFGLMLPDMDLETLMAFDLNTLVGRDQCYSALGQSFELPQNAYVPEQQVRVFINLTMNEKEYASAPIDYGTRQLWGIVGEAPLNSATAGFTTMLQDMTMKQLGADRNVNVNSPGPTRRDIDMNNNLTGNVNCSMSNVPADSDVFCMTMGDWDSGSNASLNTAMGDVFLMGMQLADSSAYSGTVGLSGLTTVGAAGDFAGIEYFGGSAALYLEDPDNTIPDDIEGGASIILDRTPGEFDAAGGSLVFDDYLPIRVLTRSGRDFTAGAATNATSQTPHYTRSQLRQKVTTTYDPCGDGANSWTDYHTLWTVYTAGSDNAFTLPTPPAGWPRASNAAPYQGLIDPTQTAADDAINWLHLTSYEGLAGTYDYNALRLRSMLESATHASLNNLDF